MTIFYKNISHLLPFDFNNLVDVRSVKIIEEKNISDQFVHKQTFDPNILNLEFVAYLKSKEILIDKIIIWNWFCNDPIWAHIDCDACGEISPCAINWTLNTNKSQVNFYDIDNIDKTVRFENEIDTGWKTDNVTAYIPINVKGIRPSAIWNDQGPALINTSIPHLIVAPELRTSVSLGIKFPVPSIEEVIRRLES